MILLKFNSANNTLILTGIYNFTFWGKGGGDMLEFRCG